MEMLEEGVLGITNEQSKLFQPELIHEDDYPSGFEPIKRNNEQHELTLSKNLTELFEQAVAGVWCINRVDRIFENCMVSSSIILQGERYAL
jgi:hypothetical protein